METTRKGGMCTVLCRCQVPRTKYLEFQNDIKRVNHFWRYQSKRRTIHFNTDVQVTNSAASHLKGGTTLGNFGTTAERFGPRDYKTGFTG